MQLRLALVLVAAVFACHAAAQPASSSRPQTAVVPDTGPPASLPQQQFVPYWTAEPGWHTEIMLRNNLESAPLTVVPSLRLTNGEEVTLPAVTVAPGTVGTLNVLDALTQSHPEVLSLTDPYGSVALRYNSPSDANLFASVMVHDTGHPIMFHLDGAYSVPSRGRASRVGIWWLPKRPPTATWY